MNVCKRIFAFILSFVIIFAAFPFSSAVLAEEVITAQVFEDNFDDESSLENYEAAVNNAYYGTTLNSKDVAPTIETVDGRNVFKARKGSSSNQYAAELVKDMPDDRRVESVTTTFKQSAESANEDAVSSVVAFHINSRNSLTLTVYPYNNTKETNTENLDYIYYSWCRFTYKETGANTSTKNNCYEEYKDQVSNAGRRRIKSDMVGDNTDWFTVTLNYDYSRIEENILTVSAVLKDTEGNEYSLSSFSAKFDDAVYDCTDDEGNVLESGQYLKYDENFKVGISSYSGNYHCYYDSFKVQYSESNAEIAQKIREEYKEALSVTSVSTRAEFDKVAEASVAINELSEGIRELLSEETAKLDALLSSYPISNDDFEYKNFSNEIWESVPHSGDIHTWNAGSSVFYTTTASINTTPAGIVADSKDETNKVLSPELRNQNRKRKIFTIKEKYLKESAFINSFSIDFRMDANSTWDNNSGIYYYYKNPYNWARIEFAVNSNDVTQVATRFMQNKGEDDGTNMVSTTLMSNTNIPNSSLGSWINIKVDYEYLTDGTNLTFTYTDKATGTVLLSKKYKTTDFNSGGRIGIGSASNAASEIYYDNFSFTYAKTAKEFKEENAAVLAYQTIGTNAQFDEVAKCYYDLVTLPFFVRNELANEEKHLMDMLSGYKILTDDFENENLTKLAFESLPETGDIMTWSTANSAFVAGTSSTGAAAQTVEETDNASNHILKAETRNQSRKRKILTLKDEYRKINAQIKSFSTDIRMDVSAGWDANTGIYYYYENPYNWGRIEFIISSSDFYLTCRVMEQSGTDEGTEMVSINRKNNTAFTGVQAGDWATVKVDYTYTEEGTDVVVNLINKKTGELITSIPFTSENVAGDFKVGYGSSQANSTEVTYYDNFAIEYTKTADEFKADNERVLALDLSTVAIEDAADVNSAISDYEALHYTVKAQVSAEYSLLKALKAKIIRMQKKDTVYISSSGNDNNNGTSGNPTATFDAAVALMNKGGAIYIDGEYVVDSKFTFKSYGKDLVITGVTLDLSALSTVNFADNITFDNVTLKFKDNANVYANGYNLTINSNVTVVGTTNLYGGGAADTTVESTNLKILSGTYYSIYGGSNKGTINGDTNVYVGGNTNPDIVSLDHATTEYIIFGGGNTDTINGNTNIVVTGNAKADYIYGGSKGEASVVQGKANIEISENMSAFNLTCGNKASSAINGVSMRMTGGEIIQVFGGCDGAGMTGDGNVTVNVELLGGKISRRFYGGCYNDVTRSGLSIKWSTTYYVNGNINVALSSDMDISYDAYDTKESTTFEDLSFYVRSRQYNKSSSEKTTLIYIDKSAYDKYKNKTGPQDSTMQLVMQNIFSSLLTTADNIYYCSYSENGSTINQSYTVVSGQAPSTVGTATVSVDEKNWEYTGRNIEPAKITYNSSWIAPKLDITYSNNIEVGTATATISTNGVSASADFNIYYDTTPSILGASIKKSLTQDVQFTAILPKNSKKVTEYGMAVTFYNNIGNGVELSDMTATTTNTMVKTVKKVLDTPVNMSQETFALNIGKIDPDAYGYRYVVRAFVKYEGDDNYYYSDNTESISQSGTDSGYMSRSVISVSKSILSWVYENQNILHNEYGVADVNAIIKKNETTGKYSWVSGITANNGEKVLAYLNDNAEAISEAINDIG